MVVLVDMADCEVDDFFVVDVAVDFYGLDVASLVDFVDHVAVEVAAVVVAHIDVVVQTVVGAAGIVDTAHFVDNTVVQVAVDCSAAVVAAVAHTPQHEPIGNLVGSFEECPDTQHFGTANLRHLLYSTLRSHHHQVQQGESWQHSLVVANSTQLCIRFVVMEHTQRPVVVVQQQMFVAVVWFVCSSTAGVAHSAVLHTRCNQCSDFETCSPVCGSPGFNQM